MITEIEQNRTERLRKMELRIEKAGLSAKKPKNEIERPRRPQTPHARMKFLCEFFLLIAFSRRGGSLKI